MAQDSSSQQVQSGALDFTLTTAVLVQKSWSTYETK